MDEIKETKEEKKVKYLINDAVNCLPLFEKMFECQELKASTSYSVVRDIRIINTYVEDYNKVRNSYFSNDKYTITETTKDANGEEITQKKIKEEFIEEFSKEINSILIKEIEDKIIKIKFDDIKDKVNLSPKDLVILEKFLDFDE